MEPSALCFPLFWKPPDSSSCGLSDSLSTTHTHIPQEPVLIGLHSVSCICYCYPLLNFIASSLSFLQRLLAPHFSKAISTLSCPFLILADPLGEAQHAMSVRYCEPGALLLPIFKIFSCLWGLFPLQGLSFLMSSGQVCFPGAPALICLLFCVHPTLLPPWWCHQVWPIWAKVGSGYPWLSKTSQMWSSMLSPAHFCWQDAENPVEDSESWRWKREVEVGRSKFPGWLWVKPPQSTPSSADLPGQTINFCRATAPLPCHSSKLPGATDGLFSPAGPGLASLRFSDAKGVLSSMSLSPRQLRLHTGVDPFHQCP